MASALYNLQDAVFAKIIENYGNEKFSIDDLQNKCGFSSEELQHFSQTIKASKKSKKSLEVRDLPKRSRSKNKKKENSSKIKRPTSAFFYYSDSVRDELRQKFPNEKMAAIAKMLGANWKALSDEDKIPFQKKANEDKARYNKEKAELDEPQLVIDREIIPPKSQIEDDNTKIKKDEVVNSPLENDIKHKLPEMKVVDKEILHPKSQIEDDNTKIQKDEVVNSPPENDIKQKSPEMKVVDNKTDLFNMIDVNNDGVIDQNELKNALSNPEIVKKMTNQTIDDDDADDSDDEIGVMEYIYKGQKYYLDPNSKKVYNLEQEFVGKLKGKKINFEAVDSDDE